MLDPQNSSTTTNPTLPSDIANHIPETLRMEDSSVCCNRYDRLSQIVISKSMEAIQSEYIAYVHLLYYRNDSPCDFAFKEQYPQYSRDRKCHPNSLQRCLSLIPFCITEVLLCMSDLIKKILMLLAVLFIQVFHIL